MPKQFTRTFRVRWSETNAIGQVDLSGYLRYLLETAWDWGAANGLSIAENEKLGLAWIIRETEVNLFRPLTINDIFDFTVWLINWRRVRGTRCFELRLKDGNELVAQGVQQVATLDSKTFRPVRLPEQYLENFVMENPRVIQQIQFPKFQLQPDTAIETQRKVEWRDLDSFEHVNNANYADLAQEAVTHALATLGWSPSTFKTQGFSVLNQRFHIQYQSPALWGEALNVAVYLVELKSTGGTWYIKIERAVDSSSVIQCVNEWSLADRITGEEQPLPENLLTTFNDIRAISVN